MFMGFCCCAHNMVVKPSNQTMHRAFTHFLVGLIDSISMVVKLNQDSYRTSLNDASFTLSLLVPIYTLKSPGSATHCRAEL